MPRIDLSVLGDCCIELNEQRITPSAPHLFALLLVLTLSQGRRYTRAGLQDLLFDGGGTSRAASHNVRQLLYRLRQFGLSFDEQAAGLRIDTSQQVDPLTKFASLTPHERALLPEDHFLVLPSYSPTLPSAFHEWLDALRTRIDSRIRALLASDLTTLYDSHSWSAVIRIGEALTLLDPSNLTAIEASAHAYAMQDRRHDALALLDAFAAEHPTSQSLAAVRATRQRISKAATSKREATFRDREEQLALLEAAWAQMQATGALQSALTGHAGIGKTRLAEEFGKRISFGGGQVLRFLCDEQSRYQPLALFSHILPDLMRMRGSVGVSPASLAVLERLGPAAHSEDERSSAGHSVELLRASIKRALVDLLEAVSSERPLLLIVDDAHLLDEASCFILRAVLQSPAQARMHIVACLRPSHPELTILSPSKRRSTIQVPALSQEASRSLLLELRAGYALNEEHLQWCLAQAAGNPFFLHTLASHTVSAGGHLPVDIRSLARTAYTSLDTDTRSVLDTCVLLGRFATVARVEAIACVDDGHMLRALRLLEDSDLVQFAEGHIRVTHALLQDALAGFVLSAVAAVIHNRIAAYLERECITTRYPPALALASARSWLAAGNATAAVQLMRRCAAHAAALGEPNTAADLLTQVARAPLPHEQSATLLDDIIKYAEVGGCRQLVTTVLRERLQLARAAQESPTRLKEFQLKIIEADLYNGGGAAPAISPLMTLLLDEAASPSVRIRAGVRLLVLADVEFDSSLASSVHSIIGTLRDSFGDVSSDLRRADLVYHTTFGSIESASKLAREIAAAYPAPGTSEQSIHSRNFAAFAFYRLHESASAIGICEDNFAFMTQAGVLSEGLYSSSLRTAIAIAEGDFEVAYAWFAKSEAVARGIPPQHLSPHSGFHANAGMLAMMEGRYDDAHRYFFTPQLELSLLSSARYRAVSLAMSIRLCQLRGRETETSEEVSLLRDLYHRGCRMGGQDVIVEALWSADVLAGRHEAASCLLREYLAEHRREKSLPEWSLRHTTTADDAWLFCPATCGHKL